MMDHIKNFLDFIDGRAVIRRIVLGLVFWLTWDSFHWAAHYAEVTKLSDGTNIGLVIAAVTAPIAALQAFVFKVYADGRSE